MAIVGTCTAVMLSAPLGGHAQTANAAIDIHDSLTVAVIQPMRFQSRAGVESTAVDASTLIQIRGGANQAYRLTFPSTGPSSPKASALDHLTAWSANGGDISPTGSGRMDEAGQDVLRIGGRLSLPQAPPSAPTTASVLVGVDYQ